MKMTAEHGEAWKPSDQVCLMLSHLHDGCSNPPPSVVSVLLAAASQRGETLHPGERPFKLLSQRREAKASHAPSHAQQR